MAGTTEREDTVAASIATGLNQTGDGTIILGTDRGDRVLTSTLRWGAERATTANLSTRRDCTGLSLDSTTGGRTGTVGITGTEVFTSVGNQMTRSTLKIKTPLIRQLNLRRISLLLLAPHDVNPPHSVNHFERQSVVREFQ